MTQQVVKITPEGIQQLKWLEVRLYANRTPGQPDGNEDYSTLAVHHDIRDAKAFALKWYAAWMHATRHTCPGTPSRDAAIEALCKLSPMQLREVWQCRPADPQSVLDCTRLEIHNACRDPDTGILHLPHPHRQRALHIYAFAVSPDSPMFGKGRT